jgi:hypothetical protein
MPEIVGLSSSISRKSLSMGVNYRIYYLVFATDYEVDFSLLYKSLYFHLHRVRDQRSRWE